MAKIVLVFAARNNKEWASLINPVFWLWDLLKFSQILEKFVLENFSQLVAIVKT